MTAMFSESSLIVPIGVHHADFKVPISFGTKDNVFTVGRPGGCIVSMVILGEFSLIPPIGIHHVDFRSDFKFGSKVPIPNRREDNAFTIGRPGGREVTLVILGEFLLIRPIGVHHTDFTVGTKDNVFTIGRPGG